MGRRLAQLGAAGASLACALLLPALPAGATTATLSPTTVTIGPDQSATQTIHIGDVQGQEVIVRVSYDPTPPPGLASFYRGNGDCSDRTGEWRCDGYRDIVITYPAITAEAAMYRVWVRIETTDGDALGRSAGWVEVQAPPPPATSEPAPEPSDEQAEPEQELVPAPAQTSDPPSTTPPPTSSEAAAPPEESGSGLATAVLSVGASVGAVGLAGALIGVWSLRRRREALQHRPRGPRPDVVVRQEAEDR